MIRLLAAVTVLAASAMSAFAADRPLVKTARVAAPPAEVWGAWTTSAGLKRFFTPDSVVELRPGGKFEVYFSGPENAPNRGSEGCTILSYLPGRMISFTWNCPPSFPAQRALGPQTFVVIEFATAAGSQATDVTLTHLGWPAGAEWTPIHDYFDKAWGRVLANLAAAFDPARAVGPGR